MQPEEHRALPIVVNTRRPDVHPEAILGRLRELTLQEKTSRILSPERPLPLWANRTIVHRVADAGPGSSSTGREESDVACCRVSVWNTFEREDPTLGVSPDFSRIGFHRGVLRRGNNVRDHSHIGGSLRRGFRCTANSYTRSGLKKLTTAKKPTCTSWNVRHRIVRLYRVTERSAIKERGLDGDTQRVYRLHDFTKAHRFQTGTADCITGKVTSADKLYLVIETVKLDAKHQRSSTVPVSADGAEGNAL
jgi:hypothetical protein